MAALLAEALQDLLDFSRVLNASIAASWAILAVLAVRFLFRRAPKRFLAALWGIAALRLLLPFSVESVLSLVPSSETVPAAILRYEGEMLASPASLAVVENPLYPAEVTVPLASSVGSLQTDLLKMNVLWLAGMALLLCYLCVSSLRLSLRLRTAVRFAGQVYESDRIASPFVFGLVKPRIYIPFGMEEGVRAHVVAHERAHIRRGDPWWKLIGFLLLSVHWFNPLAWIAFILYCRDAELAADEAVISGMSREERADYSAALLACSTGKNRLPLCPVAFGEGSVKGRIRSVFSYKKRARWITLLAAAAAVLIILLFLTDPVDSIRNPAVQAYIPGTGNILGNVDTAAFEAASPDFAIGADRYGRAVFKDPHLAFQTFEKLYAEGITLIQRSKSLAPLSKENYSQYKKYGFEMTTGTEAEREQAAFVSRFLDIYENSFAEDIPHTRYVLPTAEEDPLTVLHTLQPETVESAELVVYGQQTDKMYKRLSEEEIRTMVMLLSEAEGEKSGSFEALPRSGISLFLTLKDGTALNVSNAENAYLCLNGVYYDAPYEWLSRWEREFGEGDSPLPEQYFAARMTLADVEDIARKGETLTWGDLSAYRGERAVTGMYAVEYVLDDTFTLVAAGGSPETTTGPMHVLLRAAGSDETVDIRNGDLAAFIEAHTPKKADPSGGNWVERPMLKFGSALYVDPYMSVTMLPHGYRKAGELTAAQAHTTNLAGAVYYTKPGEEDLYVFQQSGTPISLDTVDAEQLRWAYRRYIPEGTDALAARKLTLDDVLMMEQTEKVTWADLSRYMHADVGSGLYVMRFPVDDRFYVLAGFESLEADAVPLYIRLHTVDAEAAAEIGREDIRSYIELYRE